MNESPEIPEIVNALMWVGFCLPIIITGLLTYHFRKKSWSITRRLIVAIWLWAGISAPSIFGVALLANTDGQLGQGLGLMLFAIWFVAGAASVSIVVIVVAIFVVRWVVDAARFFSDQA